MTDTMHQMMKCGCAANAVCSSMGGVNFDPPVPSCVIHSCIEPADSAPDLTGREAECAYLPRGHAIKPSDPDQLAFFEYRGEGSPWATDGCKCGYLKIAHDENRIKCKVGSFTPRGPAERDVYYCGCHGWD